MRCSINILKQRQNSIPLAIDDRETGQKRAKTGDWNRLVSGFTCKSPVL